MGIIKIKRKKKINPEVPPYPHPQISDPLIKEIAKSLTKQIDKEVFAKKYAPVKEILKLVGAGAFLATSLVIPTLPLALKPFIGNRRDYEVWKRFNIPYLKRTLRRLEEQKLVEIGEEDGFQVIKITEPGKRKILKYAIDELAIEHPKFWNGKWILVSYDIPTKLKNLRDIFRDYLRVWQFYPLHESVLLHAYPCEKQIEFLREYLGIGGYVRIFHVSKIENDKPFREFFGV